MSRIGLPLVLAVAVGATIGFFAFYSGQEERRARPVELRAKSKKLKSKMIRDAAEEDFYHERGGMEVCLDPDFSKHTLKAAIPPRPFAGMFKNLRGQRKFEASDVIKVNRNGTDQYYIVFDNLFSIGRVDASAPIHDDRNVLIGTPGIDSGYEAIVYDNVSDTFFVTIEALPIRNALRIHRNEPTDPEELRGPFVGVIRELKLPSEGSEPVHEGEPISCPIAYAFPSGNKGFEGMFIHRTGPHHGGLYLIALCEGNHCAGGADGRDAGNGRMVVLHWRGVGSDDGAPPPKALKNATCWWEAVTTLALPPDARFMDYSGVALNPKGLLAVSSQENAAVWVGEIDLSGPDPMAWHVKPGGSIYHFPRDNECRITNCNVEGITWVGQNVLVAVSDKMKSRGAQSFVCAQADQSFQQFVLP